MFQYDSESDKTLVKIGENESLVNGKLDTYEIKKHNRPKWDKLGNEIEGKTVFSLDIKFKKQKDLNKEREWENTDSLYICDLDKDAVADLKNELESMLLLKKSAKEVLQRS